MKFREYLMNNLLAWDMALNCLLKGRPGQTLSQRAATARRDDRLWGCWLCKVLDWMERDHCALAMQNDAGRAEVTLADVAAPPRGR